MFVKNLKFAIPLFQSINSLDKVYFQMTFKQLLNFSGLSF